LEKTYDKDERAHIRSALIAYMQDNKAGTPKLEKLTGVPCRTIHNFLKGLHTNDSTVGKLAAFLARQPRRPTVLHALGDTLYKFYNHPPDFIGGIYRVSIADAPLSELTIKFPPGSRTFYLASERTTGRLLRTYDGILVFTGRSLLAVLKDSLMRSARVHTLHLNPQTKTFYGLVYDDGPLERGAVPYQLLQTTLERIGNAE
jgi:hypothetical protein